MSTGRGMCPLIEIKDGYSRLIPRYTVYSLDGANDYVYIVGT